MPEMADPDRWRTNQDILHRWRVGLDAGHRTGRSQPRGRKAVNPDPTVAEHPIALMPPLDIRTLIFLLSLGNLLLFVSLMGFRFAPDERDGGLSRLWAISKLLQSVAWALMWARGSVTGFWSCR